MVVRKRKREGGGKEVMVLRIKLGKDVYSYLSGTMTVYSSSSDLPP